LNILFKSVKIILMYAEMYMNFNTADIFIGYVDWSK